MKRVIALHDATGSGKSTLSRLMDEYWGTDCLVIQEKLDDVLGTSSSDDGQASWYRRTTAIIASDTVTPIIMEHIDPLSVLVFTLTIHFLLGTVWPIILLLIVCLTVIRLCRWFNSHILSKMWLYNVFLFSHRQIGSSCQWVWRDRTCLDIYAYCLLDKATSVPSNMGSILLEETHATSVAIILDTPKHIIEKHLRTRMNASTTPRSMAIVTRLLLLTHYPIRSSIAALTLVERWYQKMNVPVIKMSQLYNTLDHDKTTGDIEWSKRSINVLLKTIERAIEQRGPPSSTIDESLMPWQIEKNSRLFHV
jgi:hypothetical protein